MADSPPEQPGAPSDHRSGGDTSWSVLGDDWPRRMTESIVDVVDTVRTRTTEPAIMVARGLVYGIVIAVLAAAASILVVTVAVRLADAYLPIGSGVGSATWAAHLLWGLVFSGLGLFAWSRRGRPDD